MAPEALSVWLYGYHVATLERRRGVLRLTYTDAARQRWGLGNPLVSLALPVTLHPHRGAAVERFFSGLLPEGQLRRTLAYDFRVAETDTLALLREIGRDCAGALVLQPASEPPSSSTTSGAEPISTEEVAERIANLPLFPLGADKKVRVSLAGMQNKLLLVRSGRGWALPTGAPSTHILKPQIAQFQDSVENEAFCMSLARHVGLRAAGVELEHFGGRPVLVVERFDRAVFPDGEIRRVHQEDVNQALGIDVGAKYESSGGPSLRRVTKLLADWRAPADDLLELMRATTFVVAVGDADHHGKNISIQHSEDGTIRLAPLYDIMSTRRYPAVTAELAMFVHGKRDIDDVRAEDLIAEGVSWGLREADAEQAVRSVLAALPEAIEVTASESPWASPAALEFLRSRVGPLADEGTGRATGAGSLSVPLPPALVPLPVPVPPSLIAPTPLDAVVPPAPADRVWVHPYRRDDGTPVRGHWRTVRWTRRCSSQGSSPAVVVAARHSPAPSGDP